MAIRLIGEREQFKHEIEGSTFTYRRLPADKKVRMVEQCTHRGNVNFEALALRACEYGITGWTNVTGDNEAGEPAPIEYDAKLIRLLPEEVRLVLGEKIIGGRIEEVAAEGTGSPF